jgi:hypothetical protein
VFAKALASNATFTSLMSCQESNGEQAMPKLSAGQRTNSGNLRISATLSKPLFRRLRTRAAKEGKTVSETVAMLCSIGLLDLDECDRFEPEVNPRPHAHQQH